ncbi:MAG TPA: tetratricopeptide repeat protein, partial [Gaiellaceae bacterium]|nr:tetratricopeptide repeat protein [Gaiellaceae bacterium]
ARLHAGKCSPDEAEQAARAALPLLEALGDDEGLVHVWQALGLVANMHSRFESWADAIEQALLHARRSSQRIAGSFILSVPLAMGPTPASVALAKLDSFVADEEHPGDIELRSLLLAMLGRVEEGWEAGLRADAQLRELGLLGGPIWLGELAMIDGDDEKAARYLREGCDEMEQRGATAQLSTYVAILARVLCFLGDPDEAERLARKGRELGDPEDVWTQALWRQAQALVHSARGEHDEAVRLVEEALGWWSRTDSLPREGEAHCDHARVLEAAGRRDEALAAWQAALDCYERKEILPLAQRVRERIAELSPGEELRSSPGN